MTSFCPFQAIRQATVLFTVPLFDRPLAQGATLGSCTSWIHNFFLLIVSRLSPSFCPSAIFPYLGSALRFVGSSCHSFLAIYFFLLSCSSVLPGCCAILDGAVDGLSFSFHHPSIAAGC
ncbi:hypothetical protein C8J56DRAFT_1174284 [Mycena floridula]|nr:hypothetical protein C8J56DRAFT_1174284 [Mycena floridula]